MLAVFTVILLFHIVNGLNDGTAFLVALRPVGIESVHLILHGKVIGAVLAGYIIQVVGSDEVLGQQHALQGLYQLAGGLPLTLDNIVKCQPVEVPHTHKPGKTLTVQGQPVGAVLPLGLLHKCLGPVHTPFHAAHLHPVQVVLAVVGLGKLPQGNMAGDLALQHGNLLGAVESVVDPGKVHAAFENAYRLFMLAGILQAQAQTQ